MSCSRPVRLSALLAAAAAAMAASCATGVPPTEPAAFRGDALVTRVTADAAREAGVPRDVLLALGWAETRLVQRFDGFSPGDNELDDAPGAPEEGDASTCGIFGLDEGTTREHAAQLVGATPDALCDQPDLEARAAARRLRELAGGDAAPALDDLQGWLAALDKWHPQLDAIGFHYGEYVTRVLALGFRGADEVNESIYLPPHEGLYVAHTEVAGTTAAARPDTPLADWRGPACEYHPDSRTRGDVDYIIIHTCEGGFAGCLSTLTRCSSTRPVSAHYVTSYTGYTAQAVEENDVAWHVGCLNSRSIGIEHEGYAGAGDYPDAQYCQTAKVVRSICDRWGIPCDRAHVIGHVEANHLFCHGSHWDPGPGWDWGTFMSYVARGGCGCEPHTETCNGHDDDCDGAVDEGVTNACGTCGAVPTETCNGRDDDCDGTIDENVCDRADPHATAPHAIDLGRHATVHLTLRNSGTTTWRAAHGYALAFGADGATLEVSGSLPGSVAPGHAAELDVTITPTREGPLGVHVEITRDGTTLEHGWTPSIEGQRPALAARFVDESLPLSVVEGEPSDGWAIVRNEGRDEWPVGTVVAAVIDAGDGLRIAPVTVDGVAPGEELRVALAIETDVLGQAHRSVVGLEVRGPDGRATSWPEVGPTQTVLVRTVSGVARETTRSAITGGCSASGSTHGGGTAALVLLALGVLAMHRRRVAVLAMRNRRLASVVVAALSVAACSAQGPLAVGAVPEVVSARGGELVAIVGHGLGTVTRAEVNGRGAAVMSRGDERVVLLVPPGAAGPADVLLHGRDGVAHVRGLFAFEPIRVELFLTDAQLPADAVESRDAVAEDFDGDGDLDVLMAVRNAPPRYLRNDGTGTFTDAPPAFVDAPSVDGIGLAAGDVDGDGDVDAFLPVYGRGQDLLLRNDGHGHLLVDAHALPADASSDHCAALADLDGDGDLDLVVGAYGADADMHRLERVLRNDGRGRFADVPHAVPPVDDRTASVAVGDLDGDSVPDLVTANDGDGDVHVRILHGVGDGTFTDRPTALAPQREAARRVLLGDLDGDVDLDLVVTGQGQDRLYLNDGRGFFADATLATMPSDDGNGDAAALADLDLDGDLDLVIGAAGEPERLYLNVGDARMRDASALLPALASDARAVRIADFDGDGAPDVLVSEGATRGDRLYASVAPSSSTSATPVPAHTGLTGGCAVAGGSGGLAALPVALAVLTLRRRRR